MTRQGLARYCLAASLFVVAVLPAAAMTAWVADFQVWPRGGPGGEVQKTRNLHGGVALTAYRPDDALAEPAAEPAALTLSAERFDDARDGYRIFTGWDDEIAAYGIWLYGPNGNRLHTWPIIPDQLGTVAEALSPEPPRGLKVLRDGSVIVHFASGQVMARLDACGTPLWQRPGLYQGRFGQAADGSLWVWRSTGDGQGVNWDATSWHLVRLDPFSGQVLDELHLYPGLLDAMASSTPAAHRDSGQDATLFHARGVSSFDARGVSSFDARGARAGAPFAYTLGVDVIPAELARDVPLFAAGDLILSRPDLGLILVVDPNSKTVKWAAAGSDALSMDFQTSYPSMVGGQGGNGSFMPAGYFQALPRCMEA